LQKITEIPDEPCSLERKGKKGGEKKIVGHAGHAPYQKPGMEKVDWNYPKRKGKGTPN